MQFFFIPFYLGLRFSRGCTGDRFSRFISILSMIGILLGVASLIIVSSVMNGFESRLKGDLLSILPHAIVTLQSEQSPESDTQTEEDQTSHLSAQQKRLTEMTIALDQMITENETILQKQPIVTGEVILQSSTGISASNLLGVPDFSKVALASYLSVGDLESLSKAGEYSVIIGESLARQLQVRVGEQIRLMVTSASTYTPLGRIPRQRLFTIAGLFSTGNDIEQQLLYTNLNDASRILGKELKKQRSYQLTFSDPFNVPSYQETFEIKGFQWSDWRAQRGTFFQAVKMEKNMMSIMLSLIIFIAIFNVISSLIMVVMDKKKEVAILKTLGLTRNKIMSVFIVQGGYSGVLGALFGGLFGVAITHYLNPLLRFSQLSFMDSLGELPTLIEPAQIATIIFSAMGLTLLVTLYPSYQAANFQPAQVLRYE